MGENGDAEQPPAIPFPEPRLPVKGQARKEDIWLNVFEDRIQINIQAIDTFHNRVFRG